MQYELLADRPEHLEQDEDFAVATFDRYLLLVWRKRVTLAGAIAAERTLKALHAERPLAPLGFITLVEEGCSLDVSSDAREAVARMLKEHNYALGAAVVIYERAGFVSAVVRSVITAINLASRAVFPNEVTSNMDDALMRITDALHDADSDRRRALRELLNQLRTREAAPPKRARLTERLAAFVRRERST